MVQFVRAWALLLPHLPLTLTTEHGDHLLKQAQAQGPSTGTARAIIFV